MLDEVFISAFCWESSDFLTTIAIKVLFEMRELLTIIYTENPLQYWFQQEKSRDQVKEFLLKPDLVSADTVIGFE